MHHQFFSTNKQNFVTISIGYTVSVDVATCNSRKEVRNKRSPSRSERITTSKAGNASAVSLVLLMSICVVEHLDVPAAPSSSPTFLPGHTYNYGVDGAVSVYVTGAEKQQTGVKIFGQVSVSGQGNCGYSLKVNSMTISGPDGKKYPCPSGIDKVVRFSLQDGRAGAEICAEEGDTRRSLNIKRAIISLLQTEQKPSTQVDVFGSCFTEVSASQEGGATLLHRSRDLSRCAHREQGRNDFITAVYNPTAEIKNTQVLQSTLNVESKVNNGVPEKISATEEYLYKPFSVGENGARAEVLTKLTLSGTTQGGANPGNCPERRTIIFENPHGAVSEQSNLRNALDALKETSKSLQSEASEKSAGKFAQVIRVLRNTNKDDLMKLFNQVKGNSLEKRVFLDALLRAGTGYSIEASIQILKGRELSGLEEKLVFLSLGNARHVNDEAMKAAATVLDRANIPKEVYLGVGALAGVYCKEHNCHSSKSEGIVALSKKLAAKLQNCKPKTKVEEDYVVAALKGIRNIRHLEDNLVDKVVQCAVDNSVKARVRVAALEAFLADPCAAKIKKAGLDLMKNRQQDSEIRIKAYLAVIGCPCGKSASEIKNLLDSEPVHQVGRFITTSLRHIRSSANPDKQLARLHYGQIGTPNRFNVDDRKYSFYREGSFNLDALGAGGSVEQTVIYSQDSFLPRSASLNLTAEVFGHSLNVLEIGGRQGNLDRVIEHFLGPKGVLRTQKPQQIYDTLVERFEKSKDKVEHGIVRRRRSIKSEVDNFDKKIKAESAPYNNELDLDVYLKLFGTDAVFLSLGDDKGFNFDHLLDQLISVLHDGVNKAKNFQNELRGHLLFLDAELAYPTSTGLALKLDLVGAATARVDVATFIDIRQCIKSPENAKVDVKLVPSTDIEVSGVMMIDADAVSTGLKVITNLHSSTGGHIIAKMIENGQGFDINFGLPLEKQEIIVASNELVYFTAEKGQMEKVTPVKVDTQNKEYKGCFDQLSDIIGLTFCGEVSVPFTVSGPEAQASISKFLARYPLTGPASVKLVLEKNNLRGYHVKGVLRRDARAGKYGVELLFDAQGCKSGRIQFNGDAVYSNDEKSLRLALDSPTIVLNGELALYTKANREYSILAKAKADALEYYGRVGFEAHREGSNSVYKPVFEYSLPDNKGKQVVKVDGQITHDTRSNEVKWNLRNINLAFVQSNDPLDLNGQYKPVPNGYDLDVKGKMGQHTVLFGSSLKNSEFKVEFQNTLNPYINFKINAHIENNREVIHNDIDLWYSGDLRNSENRVTLNQFYKRYQDSKEFSIITKNKFEIHCLPLKAKVEAQIDSKKVDIELEGQYLNRKAELDLEARTHVKKPGDYSLKLKAEVDRQGVEAFAKRDIVSADKSNFENYITIKGVGKYELSGVVLHRNKANDMNVGAVGHLKVSGGGKNEDIKFDFGVIENANLYSSHAKLSSNKGEFLDFLFKVTRGANANGQLKFILKDSISANGQFKVTDNDGKGNGMIIVDFQKAQRKIKADIKFVVKDPVYNADVDVFLNFEKDNNDKIHISTNNKKTEKSIDSKNKVEYAGKRTEVNVHQSGDLDSGKANANVEVVLPTERCLNLKFNRDVTDKDSTLNGNAELTLTDSERRGAAGSSFTYTGKVTNTNFDKDTLDYEGQIVLRLKNGKNLVNAFTLKNIPTGDGKFKGDFKIDVTGNLIPKPASLSGSTTYSDNILDETYRLKGSYGGDVGLEVVGNWLLKTDGGVKKYVDDNTVSLRLPFEKAHDIKWVSNVQFIQPEEKDFAEFTVMESIQVNSDVYKIDSTGKVSLSNGNAEIKVLVPHHDPLVIHGNYQLSAKNDVKGIEAEVQARYGKIKRDVKLVVKAPPRELDLLLVATAPEAEKLKKLELKVNNKNPAPNTYSNVITIQADDRVYKTEGIVVYSRTQPLFDLKYTSPSTTKPSRLYVKGETISSTHGKLEMKVENIKDVDIDVTCEGNVQKENVNFKGQANSAAFGLKNYKIEISSKDDGSGKRLEFHAVNDNKNLLSGSTSFISKQEGSKTIIEGSGSIKVKEDQKPANFKYIRTILSDGSETFLNLAIGERSYVAESRVTELEYKTSYLYCEEKKQCANIDLHSKINVIKPGHIEHLVNVDFDLRKLGFAPEFGLQISNEFSEQMLPKYLLDLHVNKNDKKYHMHVYCKPETGLIPAGITVTIPTRVLALESQLRYSPSGVLLFPVHGEVALYPDKNRPQQKTAARVSISADTSDLHSSAVADFGFSHPKLGEELTLKVYTKLDRPQENSLKIETSAVLSHNCFGGKRESKICLEVNPTHLKFTFDTPLVSVINLEGSAIVKDNLQQGDVKFSLLEGKPVQMHAVARDFQYYEFTTGYSDETERKLSIIGHLQPEKRVDVSVDIVLPGHKKSIAHGALYLQDNIVKSDYGLSKENFNYFVNALKNDLTNLQGRVKELGEKNSEEFKRTLDRIKPTFKRLEQSYKEDLEKLVHEITNDETLKEISEALHYVAHFLAKIIDDLLRVTKPMVDKITDLVTDLAEKTKTMYVKQLEPQIKELYANIAAIINEYFDGLLDTAAHFAALVIDFFERHKPEIEELTNTLTEIFKDLTKLLVAQLKEWRVKLSQICEELSRQVSDLPIIGILKEKWQELAVPEQAIGILRQAQEQIRQVLPTEDAKNFSDELFNYICKKLQQEKIDEVASLRVLYEKLALAVTSMVQFVRTGLANAGISLQPTFTPMSLPSFAPLSLPSWGGGASASLFTQLLRGDLPDPLAIVRAYRPRSLNPLDEIPAKLRAVVVNGQHIFTFDGRHLTFPGSCRYLLAHDHVDRNFSLVLQLQNGAPKSIILEDKNGDTIEIKDNGQVALNGANHGFPVMQKDSFGFRQPNGNLGLGTEYGLMVYCYGKLEVCYIEVNGFYLGKLRGLLGDGNNEPYDDFRMPNGKISTSESEFGNAYRLAGSCAAAAVPEHSHHQLHHMQLPAACEMVFGGTSPLRPLSLLLDIAPFRQACIHAVSGDSEEAVRQACALGRGYAALALTGLLPAVLPPRCVSCTDADKEHNVGDTYELKLPAKQADIVVAVETTVGNEKNYKELLVPLVSQLIDALKKSQIGDIKVYLVGITSKFPYPILYDTDLKLKNAKVQFTDKSRYEQFETIKTGYEKVDEFEEKAVNLVDYIRKSLGITNVLSGYRSLLDLPLRPGAVKHSISLVSDHCQKQDLLLSTFWSALYSTIYKESAHTHSIITNTPELADGNDKLKNAAGYTKHSVLICGDKKHKENEALRATIKRTDNECINFIESTDGFVFSASNYEAMNPGMQKQFLQTAAGAISKEMLREVLVQECTCTYVDPYRVRSVCFTKERKEAVCSFSFLVCLVP
ncbi:Apolipophorin [Papilio xuthus]|uniref:Apolipophorin n=2 Tax=Papilio xuthus TaxID=66420 RepID=A0A194PVU4_PAPXU|nr:Apolipophorin [Papilio xuthus]